jgi:hypothetical protein
MRTFGYMLILAFLCGRGFAYNTPNTGVNWTMTNLVASSGGAVTGAGTNFQMHADVFVNQNDTLTIEPGMVITRDDGGAWPTLAIEGKLIAAGTSNQPIIFTSGDLRGGDGDFDHCLEIYESASTQSVISHIIFEALVGGRPTAWRSATAPFAFAAEEPMPKVG